MDRRRTREAGGREIATTDIARRPAGGGRFSKLPTAGLVANLTLREIRSQYNRTALGRLWSLLNPLATIAIFSIIFGLLFRAEPTVGTNSGIHSFALWIACGIIPWGFISGGIMGAMSSLTGNVGLLTKVYFPRHVLVTSTVLSLASTFLIELAVLSVIMGIAGGPLLLAYIPVLLAILVINVFFVLGIGLLLSVAVVYFRDIQHLWGLWTQIWFYSTGVVFSAELVIGAQEQLTAAGWNIGGQPLPLVWLFEANPAHQFLVAYRSVLYDFAVPGWETWVQIIAWSAGLFAVGALVFRRVQGRIVEEL